MARLSNAFIDVRRFGLTFTATRVFTFGKWYHSNPNANDESECMLLCQSFFEVLPTLFIACTLAPVAGTHVIWLR